MEVLQPVSGSEIKEMINSKKDKISCAVVLVVSPGEFD